ncbi:MAG: hypothetical protein R3A44_14340 [Caldilineaceae bacterium]
MKITAIDTMFKGDLYKPLRSPNVSSLLEWQAQFHRNDSRFEVAQSTITESGRLIRTNLPLSFLKGAVKKADGRI